jgi:hypothetical protein
MARTVSRTLKRSLPVLALAVAALLVALNWNGSAFSAAGAGPERRPALLSDAEWGQPAPAFGTRFAPGTSEAELLRWLDDNRFEIHEAARRAYLRLPSLPCNERIDVSWTASNGALGESSAIVSEAGCL